MGVVWHTVHTFFTYFCICYCMAANKNKLAARGNFKLFHCKILLNHKIFIDHPQNFTLRGAVNK